MHIKDYCYCFWCSYRVDGCTIIWPWSSSLYVRNYVTRSIMKNSSWTVRFDPFPGDTSVWVGSSHFTNQFSCLSFNHYVWTRHIKSYFWFICKFYYTILVCTSILVQLKVLYSIWKIMKKDHIKNHRWFLTIRLKRNDVWNKRKELETLA